MKSLKYIVAIAALFSGSQARSAEHDVRYNSRNNLGNFTFVDVPVPVLGSLHFQAINPATNKPYLLTASSDFLHDNTAKTLSLNPTVWSSINGKQSHSVVLDELSTIGTVSPNEAIRTNGSGDFVAETPSNFLSWLGGFPAPAGSTSQYLRGDGSLATFPLIPAAQVQSDWTASSGLGVILNKPTLFSGAYADLTGKPSLFDGQYSSLTGIPSTFAPSTHTHAQSDVTGLVAALSAKEGTITSGTTGQYWRGDKTWAAFPSNVSTFANDASYVTSSDLSSVLSGYLTGPAAAGSYQPLDSDLAAIAALTTTSFGRSLLTASDASSARSTLGLGTASTQASTAFATASQGAKADTALQSEVDGSVTNEIELPTQTGQSGKVLTTNGTSPSWTTAAAGTVTSVTAGTGLSGGTFTSTGTISLPNTGSAGTYNSVTTDAQGRVTAGTAFSFANTARTLNSGFQVDASRPAFVSYTVDVLTTLTLTGGQTGTVSLQYADDSGFTSNLVTVQSSVNGNTGALTIGLSLSQTSTAAVTGIIPAGKYVRIATANTTGAPTFTFRAAQEVKI